MADILKGAAVAVALSEKAANDAAALRVKGVVPMLAILRVGQRADDLSYERGAMKRCAQVGVAVKSVALSSDVESNTFFAALDALNHDDTVHGILMFRPLPKQLDGEKARKLLAPEKDVDGCTDDSLTGVFTNTALGFPPCTAQAAMEILKYYDIDCKGKRAVVIGRSLVVGRPTAMMLLHENATVTICHTKTVDSSAVAREADILIACSGQMESIGKPYLRKGQIILDIGIHAGAGGRLCGDVRVDEAEPVVKAITPVPGGVGAVTSSVLAKHVIEAAKRMTGGA